MDRRTSRKAPDPKAGDPETRGRAAGRHRSATCARQPVARAAAGRVPGGHVSRRGSRRAAPEQGGIRGSADPPPHRGRGDLPQAPVPGAQPCGGSAKAGGRTRSDAAPCEATDPHFGAGTGKAAPARGKEAPVTAEEAARKAGYRPLVSCPGDRCTWSLDLLKDGVGGGSPHEGLRARVVVVVGEAEDLLLELADGGEGAPCTGRGPGRWRRPGRASFAALP